MKIAPPAFEVVYHDMQPVQLRIGPDILHPNCTVHEISDVTDMQAIASTRIDMLRKVNDMLDRCTMNELRQVNIATQEDRLSFALAAGENNFKRDTVVEDALYMAVCQLGHTTSACAIQKLWSNFLTPYVTEIDKHAVHTPEDLTKALKIACVQLSQAGLGAYDKNAVIEFSQSIENRIDNLWQARNQKMLDAWQFTDEARDAPSKFYPIFKETFMREMTQCLQDTNWAGDMALVYTAAYHAAYRAGETALQQEDVATTEQYARLQDRCVAALDAIRQEDERNAYPVDIEHDRGYQPYDTPEEPILFNR
jgi:hypothetical protein